MTVFVRAAICLTILCFAIGVTWVLVRTGPTPAKSEHGGAPPRVVVMTAQPVPVRRQWEGFGTARALNSADVPARVTAIVNRIHPGIVEGARVEQGDLLVELDDSDFVRQKEIAEHSIEDLSAQLDRLKIEEESWQRRAELARQQVELAQAEYDRAVDAQQRDAAKQREVDAAKQPMLAAIRDEVAAREEFDKLPSRRAGLEAQRQGYETQKRIAVQSVERCRIHAPREGVLEVVDVEEGESLTAGERVARLVDLSTIEILLRVPSSARTALSPGDSVRLRATGSDDRTWDTVITRLAPVEDELDRTAGVYVEIDQSPDAVDTLAPGKFLRATIDGHEEESRFVVPRRALDGEFLLLVRESTIHRERVEVDFSLAQTFPQFHVPDEQWVVLREPLAPNEQVVITVTRQLVDGLKVEAVSAGEVEGNHVLAAEAGSGS